MHHKVIVACAVRPGGSPGGRDALRGPVRLLEYSEQVFIQPLCLRTGRYIACTGEHYQGIWVVRLEDRQVRRLSDAPEAALAWLVQRQPFAGEPGGQL
jgi:hypothetical protein